MAVTRQNYQPLLNMNTKQVEVDDLQEVTKQILQQIPMYDYVPVNHPDYLAVRVPITLGYLLLKRYRYNRDICRVAATCKLPVYCGGEVSNIDEWYNCADQYDLPDKDKAILWITLEKHCNKAQERIQEQKKEWSAQRFLQVLGMNVARQKSKCNIESTS